MHGDMNQSPTSVCFSGWLHHSKRGYSSVFNQTEMYKPTLAKTTSTPFLAKSVHQREVKFTFAARQIIFCSKNNRKPEISQQFIGVGAKAQLFRAPHLPLRRSLRFVSVHDISGNEIYCLRLSAPTVLHALVSSVVDGHLKNLRDASWYTESDANIDANLTQLQAKDKELRR